MEKEIKSALRKMIMSILGYLILWGSIIWIVAELVLSVTKTDHPFNWWSVWTFLIFIVFCIIIMFLGVIALAHEHHKDMKSLDTSVKKKSKFQMKIEEMERLRKPKNGGGGKS